MAFYYVSDDNCDDQIQDEKRVIIANQKIEFNLQ
jgi:hypothetical protein